MSKSDIIKLINIHGCLSFMGSWGAICQLHGRITAVEDDMVRFTDNCDRHLKMPIKDIDFKPVIQEMTL